MARKIIRVANGTCSCPNQDQLGFKGSVKYYPNIQRVDSKIFPFIIFEKNEKGEDKKIFSFELKPFFGKSGITLEGERIINLPSGEKIFIGGPFKNRLAEKIRNNTYFSFDFRSMKGSLIVLLRSVHSNKNLLSAKIPIKTLESFLEVVEGKNEKT